LVPALERVMVLERVMEPVLVLAWEPALVLARVLALAREPVSLWRNR
jgi:hypothetical protein